MALHHERERRARGMSSTIWIMHNTSFSFAHLGAFTRLAHHDSSLKPDKIFKAAEDKAAKAKKKADKEAAKVPSLSSSVVFSLTMCVFPGCQVKDDEYLAFSFNDPRALKTSARLPRVIATALNG